MAAEKLFPERQRCKTCSKGLGATPGSPVYLGLFCTPRCAGIAVPHTDPEKAPRECKTQREGSWVFKRRYRSVGEIPDRIRQDASANWYTCSHCGHLHLGHSRMGTAESFRKTRSRADVADLLVKLRGAATHKQVAVVAGIRPIRVKELEDPSFKGATIEDLLALAGAYRVDLGFVLTGALAGGGGR